MKHLFTQCLLVSFGIAASAWGADPFVGTWKVDPEKSKASTGQPGARQEVVKIEEQGANLLVAVKGTSVAGKAYSYQYTVPKKGGHVTYISAAPATHFDEMKRIDEHTLDATMIRDGKVVQAVHGTVSADGKMITLVGKGTDAQGRPLDYVEVQERQ